MKTMTKCTLIAIALLLCIITGCQESLTQGSDDHSCNETLQKIEEIEGMTLEFYACEHSHPISLDGHFENGDLILKGRIKRGLQACCDVVVGHIDFAIFSDDGYLIKVFSLRFSPRNIPKTGRKSSGFKARISDPLPTNPIVKVIYHETTSFLISGANDGKLDCGDNRVLHVTELNGVDR